MSKTKKKMLVPKLRFPEFLDMGEWEEKGLCNYLFRHPEYGINAPAVPYTENLPTYLRITDISEDGNFIQKQKVSVAKKVNEENYLYDDDIVLARTGASVGKSYKYNKVDGDLVFAGFLIRVRADQEKLNSELLFQFLSTEQYWRWVDFSSARSGQPGINSNEYASLPIPLPPTLGEQQKIADCLSSIDALITAQTQKIDALKAHKKGLMQQFFPAVGETVPKLRFPEFRDAGEWKIKPFDKLFTIGNGKDHKHLPSGDIPVYGSGGYMRSVNEYLYDGESACIGRKGTINNPIFLTGKFWTVDTLFYTHSFKECLPRFIYLIFQNINWLKHNEAGGVPSLSKANIGQIEVAVPNPNEQLKIADCFLSIDKLLTAQAQKLDALKAHKKGLMQQLFPSTDEVGA